MSLRSIDAYIYVSFLQTFIVRYVGQFCNNIVSRVICFFVSAVFSPRRLYSDVRFCVAWHTNRIFAQISEITPSICRTYRRNSPRTYLYAWQCSVLYLRRPARIVPRTQTSRHRRTVLVASHFFLYSGRIGRHFVNFSPAFDLCALTPCCTIRGKMRIQLWPFF